MRRGILSVVAAAVTVIGLVGCVGPQPLPTLPPSPSSTPIFASEEEALAAAEDAYAAYLEMSNLISSEGGVDPERIADVVVGEFYELALQGFETLRENGWRSVGSSVLEEAKLQFADLAGEVGEEVVAAYVCVDVSEVDVVDANGTSVVSSDRPALQAFEVFFELTDARSLTPSSRQPWDAGAACTG